MKHGISRYNAKGCRCDECKAAKSAAHLRFNERHRESESARVKQWNAENPGKASARVKQWRKDNREKHLDHKRQRYGYERSAGARDADIDFESIWTGCCGICGGNMDRQTQAGDRLAPTIDHIIPLSQGGSHTLGNLQWAHMACNAGKGARV